MNATREEWRAVLGYEGLYEVSSHGRVRSLDRTTTDLSKNGVLRTRRLKGRLRSAVVNKRTGYPAVILHRDGSHRTMTVHTLVLEAFVSTRPVGMEACHGNGIRTDNHIENLRWDTSSENSYDTVRHGNNRNAVKTHCARGHSLSDENLVRQAHGRACRICKRAAAYADNHSVSMDAAVAHCESTPAVERHRTDRSRCMRGHSLTPENRRPGGGCRICHRARTYATTHRITIEQALVRYEPTERG